MKTRPRRQPNRIAAALQPFVDRHALAGAVTLVATKDKILDVTAVGFADIAAHKPMQPDSVFWIASTTKPMTGTALMMLVDEGRVSVNDPITKYLPEFASPMVIAEQSKRHTLLRRVTEPIRLRHLLTHTSGLPFRSGLETPTMDHHPLHTRVQSYAMLPLQSKPGTKYLYSNAGINIAARILEIVTGQSYEDFMATRLFQPLGLTATTFWPSAAQVRRLPHAYRPDAAKTGLEKTTIAQLHYPLSDRHRPGCGALRPNDSQPRHIGRPALLIQNSRRPNDPQANRAESHQRLRVRLDDRPGLVRPRRSPGEQFCRGLAPRIGPGIYGTARRLPRRWRPEF